jgi:hypothetical protein
VEEWIYRLERDEESMLKRIQGTNFKTQGIDGFLNSRMGGTMGDLK